MIVSNVSNTKNKLSELLRRVQAGETVMIVDRDQPVARIVPIGAERPDSTFERLVMSGVVSRPARTAKAEPSPAGDSGGASLLGALLAEREDERA